MDNTARTRQRVLALFLPIAAVLYIGAEAVSPNGTDQVLSTTATALKVLPIASKHSAQLYLASFLALLGLGALAVSYAAIAMLVRERGATLATVAALVGGLGAFFGAIVNVLVYPVLAAAATTHVPPDSAAKILVTGANSGFVQIFEYVYIATEYLAPLLMAIALWRSRAVPRWLAVLFFAGLELAEQMGSYGPIVIVFMLPFAAAMVLLAVLLWRTASSPVSQRPPVDPAPPRWPDLQVPVAGEHG
jgi:hypothetical protein